MPLYPALISWGTAIRQALPTTKNKSSEEYLSRANPWRGVAPTTFLRRILDWVISQYKFILGGTTGSHPLRSARATMAQALQNRQKSLIDLDRCLQDPEHIDGFKSLAHGSITRNNEVIYDFLNLVSQRGDRLYLSAHSRVAFSSLPPQIRYATERRLSLLLRTLKKLSHSSGLIAARKSGYRAFSHYLETGYLYLTCDPHPTLDGLFQVLSHDIFEDPRGFAVQDEAICAKPQPSALQSYEALSRWLESIIGRDNAHSVQSLYTKEPPQPGPKENGLSPKEKAVYDGFLKKGNLERATDYLKSTSPAYYHYLKQNRNTRYIESIVAASDAEFLQKMPDVLSNMRTLDAFILMEDSPEGQSKGREKIIRKLTEVCEHYLPRLIQMGESGYIYLVLIRHELMSLNIEYHLGLENTPLSKVSPGDERKTLQYIPPSGKERNSEGQLTFAKKISPERAALAKKGIFFDEVHSRALTKWKIINRSSLNLRPDTGKSTPAKASYLR